MTFERSLNTLPDPPQTPAEKLRAALALYDEGVAMQRLTLRSQHPGMSDEQLERALDAWLAREP